MKVGDPGLTAVQRAVRMAFFLWVSLLNLLLMSAMWARVADVFSSDAGVQLKATVHVRMCTCISHG